MFLRLKSWIGKHKLASIGLGFGGLFTLCCVCLGVVMLISPPARDSGGEAVAPVSTRPRPTRTPRRTLTPEEFVSPGATSTSPVATLDVMATATFFAEQVAETQTVEAQAPTDVPAPETPIPTESILPTQPAAPTVEPVASTPIPNSAPGGEAIGECTTGCSVSTPPAGCVIKGNVNSDHEKIYHTPGQRDYERTQIRPEQGDAWFCTEAAAVAAGFRHARR